MSTFEDLNEDQKSILEEFRNRLGSLDPVYDDFYLYRFLKARNFNLEKAEYMIREHFKMVQLHGLRNILENFRPVEAIFEYLPLYYIGTDTFGNAVISLRLGSCDLRGLTHCVPTKNHLNNCSYFIEKIFRDANNELQKIGKKARKLVAILDLEGLQYLQLLDRRVGKMLILVVRLLDPNFPELMECGYFINTPSFFPPWFNVLKKITNSEPLKKAKFYSRDGWKEELLKIIDAEKLPAVLGGKLTDPDGCVDCRTMYVKGGRIPESFYLSAQRPNFKNEKNVKDFLVREKSFFNCELFVKEKNFVISWCFQTDEYNIGFGIYYVPNGIKPMPETAIGSFSKSFRHRVRSNPKHGHVPVVPVQRTDSHLFVEEGEYVCEKSGTYLLHFDNTFSWVTPKQLYYKFEVITSDNQLNRLLLGED